MGARVCLLEGVVTGQKETFNLEEWEVIIQTPPEMTVLESVETGATSITLKWVSNSFFTN